MEMDRRTFLSMSALAGSMLSWPSLGQAAPAIRTFRASLGSPVLIPEVCFFWIGMHPKLNYYLEEDLIAQWRGVQSQTQALGLLANESQEVGGVGPSTLMGLAARGTRVPLKVAYSHYQRNPYRGIALRSSGIKSWADVKGKRVGLVSLGQLSTKWYTEAAMREAGVDPKDVSFVPVGINATAGIALKNHEIDVYVSFSVHTARVASLGFDVVPMPRPAFAEHSFDGGMTVNTHFLAKKENKSALGGFFRAVAKGEVFSFANPRAAIQIHYDMFPAALPKGIPYKKAIDTMTSEYKLVFPDLDVENTQKKMYGWMTKKSWETIAYDIMQLKRGKIPPVTDFYTTEVLEKANNFDRKAIVQQAKSFKL